VPLVVTSAHERHVVSQRAPQEAAPRRHRIAQPLPAAALPRHGPHPRRARLVAKATQPTAQGAAATMLPRWVLPQPQLDQAPHRMTQERAERATQRTAPLCSHRASAL